jgi:hypothetical protein
MRMAMLGRGCCRLATPFPPSLLGHDTARPL